MDKNLNASQKQSIIRTWFQAAFFVVTNGYVRGFSKGRIFVGNTKAMCLPGLNCYSCPGALAACPMGALQAVLGDVGYRVSLYVFGILAAMGVIFGRLICGWMCPFGLVQDLLHKIPFMKKIKNLPGHKYLKNLRYVILVVFPILLVSLVTDKTGTGSPWFCEWLCPSGMLLGGIPLITVNAGLREAIGGRFVWKLLILVAIILASIKSYRPFCKYLCPLGAIYGFFNPISSYRLVVDTDKCVSCGKCQKACGMDIKTYENPNSMDCIRCGSCISACPEGAISSTWGKTANKVKSRCFVDDSEDIVSNEDVATDRKWKSAIFGVITAFIGLFSFYGTYTMGIYTGLKGILTTDFYIGVNKIFIAYDVILIVAAALMTLTGVYTVIKNSDAKALATISEKMKMVSLIAWLDVAFGIIVTQIDARTIQFVIEALLLLPILLLWAPIGTLVAKKFKN